MIKLTTNYVITYFVAHLKNGTMNHLQDLISHPFNKIVENKSIVHTNLMQKNYLTIIEKLTIGSFIFVCTEFSIVYYIKQTLEKYLKKNIYCL